MNVTVTELVVSVASPRHAAGMVEVIRAAFGARPRLDPPSTAETETPTSVAAALVEGGGIFAEVGGRPAGALVIKRVTSAVAAFTRVSVHPDFQRHGVAAVMVAHAQDYAAELGFSAVELFAREEFGELIAFWRRRGFEVQRLLDHGVVLGRPLPVAVRVPTAAAMRKLGKELAKQLQPGDLVIASGDLGAGKTTLTQGIGAGLGSAEPILSPTFVLSRVHHSTLGRPSLVHVDAYRLSSADEVDDLALEDSAASAVTVVEWGSGLAEHLAESRLEIDIQRAATGSPDGEDARTVLLRGVGPRWNTAALSELAQLRLSPRHPSMTDRHDRPA